MQKARADIVEVERGRDFPEVEFRVAWVCNDARCKGHEMGMMQWGLHEMYRKLEGDSLRKKKVEDAMRLRLDMKTRDVFLVLGNFRTIMWNFGLMDSFSAVKRHQLSLW